MSREDIISFLESYRKPEASDVMHKWIGTYNIYRVHLVRFFKWLYYPDLESKKRPKPVSEYPTTEAERTVNLQAY